jgi:HEAT repeat protein
VIDKAEVMLLGRRNRRVFRVRLLLLGLVGALLCAGCASGTATPVSGLADQDVQVAIEGLGHEDIQVRITAAETLCGLEPEISVPALLQALRDTEDASVRSEIVGVLGRIGPEDGVAPALIETLLHDKDREVRGHAAVVLGKGIGPEEGVVPALIQAMVDDPSSHWAVAEGLTGIGPPAEEAVPALIDALDECASDNDLACDVERSAIVRALQAITGQDFAEDASAWREWWEEQQ